jgi:hypothetical protein
MQPKTANLINALALVLIGLWGAMGSSSMTAYIPVIGGVILLGLQSGVAKENKLLSHIAVVVTLVMLAGLFKPFTGAMGREDTLGMIRVGIMLATGLFAMIIFVQSFIKARQK